MHSAQWDTAFQISLGKVNVFSVDGICVVDEKIPGQKVRVTSKWLPRSTYIEAYPPFCMANNIFVLMAFVPTKKQLI